ncbi:MAG TPA: glycosyltransferase family 4 protein [Casimicrobiaceae bacterium]
MSRAEATEAPAEERSCAPPRSITLVGPLPPPAGGMANQTRQLAQLLAREGCDVTFVQGNAPYYPAWVGAIRGLRALFRLLPYLCRLWAATRRARIVHVMANSGWAWHLVAAPAIWIAHFRGAPGIVHYHGGEAEKFFESQFRFVRPTLKLASAVIVPSGFLRDMFDRWNVSADIVPNVIDLARLRPGTRSTGRLHVIVARNLEDVYDIPTAIRAFAVIREQFAHATLSVAGSGPALPALRTLCGELGIDASVTFTGQLEGEQMAQLYRGADLFLNPSLADNLPVSILEALASGVPIVSTNVGGIPFVVESERTALLVPPRDPTAMAEAALRLLRDGELAVRLRANGLKAVEVYSWPQVRDRLFSVYRRVLRPPMTAACAP